MDTVAADATIRDLLDRRSTRAARPSAEQNPPPVAWLETLIDLIRKDPHRAQDRPRRMIEALIGEIDLALSDQLNAILHASAFQELEASWRGIWLLVRAADGFEEVKIRVLTVSKHELSRTMRKYRGNAWDQSPIFRLIYEEEYGQLGGEPYGILVGDYSFDHRGDDIVLLTDIMKIAAAAHAPFLSSAAPTLLGMDSWSEIANPRDLARIFSTPEYVSWRGLRELEDARYIGLCMPRFLARLPYGTATDPLDVFSFEEEAEGVDQSKLLWGNPAYAFAANVIHAYIDYGWCVRIRGIDRGGVVEGLPVMHHPTADGDVDRRTVTEICLSERRDNELAACGLIPLVHRKNTNLAAFISAQSLQKPAVYDNPDASTNAALSARLPYMFATCRFAHYLKTMVRSKVGTSMTMAQVQTWLQQWLLRYVDGSPDTSSEDFKATHPLADARVLLEPVSDAPGNYAAKIFLKPHYQLEGLSVSLRLVSRVPNG